MSRRGSTPFGGIAAGLLAAALALPALVAPTVAAPAATSRPARETAAPIGVRVFKIQFKDPSDVAQLVGQLLTEKGSVSFSPKLKTLTVQDRRDVLDRVAEAIASYDLPPRDVQFTVTLILASMGEQAKQPISREVRGIADALSNVTKWTEYKPLGSSAISGSEGSKVSLDIEDYRIEFDIESVSESRGIIRLNPLILQRAVKGADGAVSYRNVQRQTCNLTNDRLLTIGATKSESDSKAVFLSVRARIATGVEESLANKGNATGAAGRTPRNR